MNTACVCSELHISLLDYARQAGRCF